MDSRQPTAKPSAAAIAACRRMIPVSARRSAPIAESTPYSRDFSVVDVNIVSPTIAVPTKKAIPTITCTIGSKPSRISAALLSTNVDLAKGGLRGNRLPISV